jgi:WD40 repeat protein
MLPDNRLATLLHHVKRAQIDSCLYHTNPASPSLYTDHVCDGRLFPREVAITLDEIPADVWQIRFSHDGRRLAGTGLSGQIIVYDLPTFSVSLLLGPYTDGVGNLSWSPDDTILAACCRDKHLRLFDTNVSIVPLLFLFFVFFQ